MRFRAFLIERGLPRPLFNTSIEVHGIRIEPDCLWREQRLIVEVDGAGPHNTRRAIERDKRRDRRLAASGWTVIRVTWAQLHNEPDELERDLRRALATRSSPA